MEVKPIKRNENIKQLSREHHFGLLFCWKIRMGLKKDIPLGRIRRYINYYWTNHWRQHFKEEEAIFYLQIESDLCVKGLAQHKAISDMIKIINAKIVDRPETYMALVDIMDEHIRFEERALFPYLETVLSDETLSVIGTHLKTMHATTLVDDFSDEFWISK